MRIEHIGDATLILADCMDVMRDMPDKAFDLAIVDPPYGIGEDGGVFRDRKGGGHRVLEKKNWDKERPKKKYFSELFRITENQIIWGANHLCDLFNAKSPGWIYWDKMMGGDFSDGELAFSSFDTPLKAFSFCNKYHGKTHPTEKPVALYKWLLSRYAKPGDTILDTHGGSGSSVVACLDMGHSITWIENDEDYFNAALKRIKDFAAQPKLPLNDTPEPVEQWLGFEEAL